MNVCTPVSFLAVHKFSASVCPRVLEVEFTLKNGNGDLLKYMKMLAAGGFNIFKRKREFLRYKNP